jgi:hypothetical protein
LSQFSKAKQLHHALMIFACGGLLRLQLRLLFGRELSGWLGKEQSAEQRNASEQGEKQTFHGTTPLGD